MVLFYLCFNVIIKKKNRLFYKKICHCKHQGSTEKVEELSPSLNNISFDLYLKSDFSKRFDPVLYRHVQQFSQGHINFVFSLNKATSSIFPFYFIYFSNILFTLSGSLAVASHLLLAGFWRGTHSPPWSKDTTDCTELSGTTRQNFYSCRNFVGTPVWK